MRIAFLTHEPFYPPSGGGSAEAIYLVQELVRRKHEVHIFCPAVSDSRAVMKKFGVHLHEFHTWKMGRYARLRNLKYLLFPFFLSRLVESWARKHTFDLILSQHAIAAVAAGKLKRKLGIPVIMNFLDYLTAFMETWPSYLAPPALLRILKQFELSLPRRYRADAVLAVSDTLADLFKNTGYPPDRTLPIQYGFDSELFPFYEPNEKTDSKDPAIVVMHGSLDHHHIGSIALTSIRDICQARPGTIFRFVGQRTRTLESFLHRLEQVAPSTAVETTGFIPYSEVCRHLQDASVGIVPYEESTGTHCAFVAKIVEYLAIGLPVASTPLANAKRYFAAEPMIRFSDFDGPSFGQAVLSWLPDAKSTRSQFAKMASDRVRENLDWRVICRRAVDFIENIAQSGGLERHP
ncbi:MAG: glycosyltransferase family 4 protein [Verrucomicrobia bacterium]|nr:glycosyltransferase family 4 protein [Verrucomicrobiota bacterium]